MGSRRRSQYVRSKYAFIKAHRDEFDTAVMCRVLRLSRSGYYVRLRKPLSDRALEDQRLLGLIRKSYTENHGVYGAPRIFLDLREAGETCSKHRVARVMRINKIRALHGYRSPRYARGHSSIVAPNALQRGFNLLRPNQARVTVITYVRTWEGWLYLAVVIGLYSRRIVAWSTKPTLARELVLDAVLMAVRRRKPKKTLIHSDQGSQYGGDSWRRFCRDHNLEPSMSRRGNCWDNAVAESFFSSLKKERIKKRIYTTRDIAKADLYDYIERFYDRDRRHSHLCGVSPETFEASSQRAQRCSQ